MDWLYPFSFLIGSILVLMGLGLPVAFAFFATNIAGLFLFFGGARGVTPATKSNAPPTPMATAPAQPTSGLMT